jgi:hypothetical protein
MSVLTTSRVSVAPATSSAERRHRFWLTLSAYVAIAFTLGLAIYGLDYYPLDQAHRALSPKHAYLKPSGILGLRLGLFGVFLFLLIYLYAIRKHWSWLARRGNSRHWLNFHVLMGVMAPVVITFHSSFKFHGIAGVAYWIMLTVMLSGFIGRYIYSLIPRSLGAAELSLKEMSELSDRLAQQLNTQKVLCPGDFAPLLRLPDAAAVQSMSALGALWRTIRYDLTQPWRIWRLRRKALRSLRARPFPSATARLQKRDLENVISCVRKQASLSKRILFLSKTQELLQLWHIVHLPFSYSFVILALIHISVALLLGYF